MKVISKRTLVMNGCWLEENNKYEAKDCGNYYEILIDDEVFKFFKIKKISFSYIHIYFENFFYSNVELRKMKIDKLLKK